MVRVENCGCAEIYLSNGKDIRKYMQKKKTFSTMEIILLGVVIGSLVLSFLQSWREEKEIS